VNPNYAEGVNVEDQQQDPASLWHFYRRMLHLRRSTPALVEGDYLPLHPNSEEYLAFLRRAPQHGQSVLVVLNMSPKAQALKLDELLSESDFSPGDPLRLIFSSHPRPALTGSESYLAISPFEVYIAKIGGAA
jgi:glycosidase